MSIPQDRINEAAQILLVDDEEAVRDLLQRMFEAGGFEVSAASGGPAALDICRQSVRPPRLLVTDIQMPEMSGYELADRCSQLYPDMAILFVSGSVPDEEMQAAVHGRNRAFLAKPVRMENLHRVAKSLLARPGACRPPRRRAPSTEPGHFVQGDYLQA